MFRIRHKIHEFILFVASVAYILIEKDTQLAVLGLAALLAFQFLFQNRITGLTISGSLMIAAVWFIITVVSDFSEVSHPDNAAMGRLAGGVLLFLVSSVISVQMLAKYLSPAGSSQDRQNED